MKTLPAVVIQTKNYRLVAVPKEDGKGIRPAFEFLSEDATGAPTWLPGGSLSKDPLTNLLEAWAKE